MEKLEGWALGLSASLKEVADVGIIVIEDFEGLSATGWNAFAVIPSADQWHGRRTETYRNHGSV